MTPMRAPWRARGVTLIELVVAITVIAIAISGVLGVLSSLAARSADAMIREQATAIAVAHLNEILLKSYNDTDGVSGGARDRFDDIDDYNHLPDNIVRDQFGNAVNGVDQFQVSVAVVPGALGGIPANDVRRVDVTVRHPNGVVVLMSGYRTRYP